MTRTLIRNATVVLPNEVVTTSVLVDGGTIAHVGVPAGAAHDELIDASGLHLFPGLIDDQVHFREPGLTHKEDLYTASMACAAGGVTTFLEMPNTNPTTTSQAALVQKLALAERKSIVNYGFYVGATPTNVVELRHARRTPGIKIFVGSSTGDLLVDEQEALETIYGGSTLPICVHAEDETTIRENRERLGEPSSIHDHSRIRDHRAAAIATERICDLAVRHRHRTHILHVSSATELPIIARYLPSGYITAEACIHHLLLNTGDYDRLGTLAQMNPSLKGPEDNEQIWQALRDLTLQVVATDHAPHTLEEKAAPYPRSPSGMPNVQTLLTLMLQQHHLGRCTLPEIARWTALHPALTWDICNKGAIIEGYDADLTLVDLNATRTITNDQQLSKCGWTAFDGVTTTGWPTHTMVGGRLVFADERVDTSVRGAEASYDHDRGGYWARIGEFAP